MLPLNHYVGGEGGIVEGDGEIRSTNGLKLSPTRKGKYLSK